MTFLRVKNWERFQHYSDRRPPWIKYHVELLDDHGLQLLPTNARLVYSLILLVAARTDNNIPSDPQYIGRQIAMDSNEVEDAVQTLVDTGFLIASDRKRAASKALAKRKRSAKPETEVETEKKKRARTRANDKTGDGPMFLMRTMIANGAIVDEEHLTFEMDARDCFSEHERAQLLAELKKRPAAAA